MPLQTKRLGATEHEPLSFEVTNQIAPASTLLWHLCRLPDLRVVAKKSWALTDDFEAYFLYKGRLFVMETPFANVSISLLGQPTDELLFSQVESHVQGFSAWNYLLAPMATVRYFFKPFNPPRSLLERHRVA